MKLLLFASSMIAMTLAQTAAAHSPFVVVAKKNLAKTNASVLYEGHDYALVRAADAESQDFSDLYWVNLKKVSLAKAGLDRYGKVLHAVDGQYAVMRLSTSGAELVSHFQHEAGMACGGLFRLLGDSVPAGEANKASPAPVREANEDIQALRDLVTSVNPANIRTTVENLSSNFTRYHTSTTGRGVAQGLAESYQSLAAGRSDVEVTTFNHGSRTSQPSLHVTIRGTSRPDEIIILGSHIDSVAGFMGNGRAPGADDNASGTATNLEIFRIIMERGLTFDRTIEIHGYAAEEIGLVGSQDMARQYKSQGKNVVAMFQIDMNLYRDTNVDKIWFVTNNTNATLTNDLINFTKRYVGVAYDSAVLDAGSSDHESWTRQGYAAAFPFENPLKYNRRIHTADDTIANSGAFSQAAAFAKLGLAYLAHYAGLKD